MTVGVNEFPNGDRASTNLVLDALKQDGLMFCARCLDAKTRNQITVACILRILCPAVDKYGSIPIILHGFWASSCTWRARAALHHKGLLYRETGVDILKGDHLTEDYRSVNPAQKVPALEIDGVVVVESMAILQYLEETRPRPPLLPDTPLLRARMREIVDTITTGIQPLQNPGLKRQLESTDQFQSFAAHWTDRGLQTLEPLLSRSSGTHCVGDQLTMADLCLVPQLTNAERNKIDITKYPVTYKIYKSLLKEQIFVETHPRNFKPK